MEVVKHSKYIYQYFNVATEKECKRISRYVESSDSCKEISNNRFVYERTNVRNNFAIDVSFSAANDDKMMKADNLCHQYISEIHRKYVTENKSLYFFVRDGHFNNLTCSYIFRKYDKNDYYEWHADVVGHQQLVFSYILYLNDDFEGGDTLFLDGNLRITPKAGSVLCFPCGLTTVHKSTLITEGCKNIIWAGMAKVF